MQETASRRKCLEASLKNDRLKVRSVVGLLPLCAPNVIEPWKRERVPKMMKLWEERSRRNPEMVKDIFHARGGRT